MRKLVLYIATSIDGYIARPNGKVDWLEYPDFMIEGEDFGYQKFIKTIDTTIMGGDTYKEVLGFGIPWPYADKKNYVFTRSNYPPMETVTFVGENIGQFVKELKAQPGKDIWLIGGGKINSIMIEENLIDEMIISVMPITIGEGIPMFSRVSHEQKFHLKDHKVYKTGVTQWHYAR
ncbi:MAG: dihydrofolate reductase [Cyclobacteriaceae bacterium]|nr:dihydrofolate reductase [Cyclobacteriaceae bacterium SS2]